MQIRHFFSSVDCSFIFFFEYLWKLSFFLLILICISIHSTIQRHSIALGMYLISSLCQPLPAILRKKKTPQNFSNSPTVVFPTDYQLLALLLLLFLFWEKLEVWEVQYKRGDLSPIFRPDNCRIGKLQVQWKRKISESRRRTNPILVCQRNNWFLP